MSLIQDLACALFGHIMEIEAENAFTTTVRCSRCGGGNRYHWNLDDDFIRKHGLARDERPDPEENPD